jgi:hypothetical protein
MVEWDDKIPHIEDLLSLCLKLNQKWQKSSAVKVATKQVKKSNSEKTTHTDVKIHQEFWNHIKNKEYISEIDVQNSQIFKGNLPTPAHIGMNVYSSAYYNRFLEVLEKSFPVLKIALNDVFNDVMLDYLQKYPSTFDSIDFLGKNLATFIQAHLFSYNLGVDQLIISDIANFEYLKNLSQIVFTDQLPSLDVRKFNEASWSEIKIKLKSEALIGKFNSQIHSVIKSIETGEVPEIPALEETYYIFCRQPDGLNIKEARKECINFLNLFTGFKTFISVIDAETTIQLQASAVLLFENEKYFCLENSVTSAQSPNL